MASIKLLGFSRSLIRLNLRSCNLVDGDISFVLCKLSNLQVLNLSRNKFSRLHSSLLQLSRLKFLDLSGCLNLLELPDLSSSIAILIANWCNSLQIVGGLPTNLKWLWKVSLFTDSTWVDGKRVVQSMLQGNAVEEYFLCLYFDKFNISTRDFGRKTRMLDLPWNWYNEFSGFLIYLNRDDCGDDTDVIIIEDEMGREIEDDVLEVSDEISDEDEESKTVAAMCYISFGSLKHTTWWNSTHTKISFSIAKFDLKVQLVPRSKGDSIERPIDATDSSEFWDEEVTYRKTFEILHDSKSSLGVLWCHDLYADMYRSI